MIMRATTVVHVQVFKVVRLLVCFTVVVIVFLDVVIA